MLLLLSGDGCRKSNPSPAPAPAAAADTVARLHWLGIQGLARDTNTANFLSVWNLPESQQLLAQTLDKLTLALTGELPGGGSNQLSVISNRLSVTSNQLSVASNQLSVASSLAFITNRLSTSSTPLAVKLRPLLEDLALAEAYVELRQATNQPGELALAIRLDEQRAGLWTSNLTAVLGSFINVQSLPAPANCSTWRLPFAPPASRLDLARAGEWTLVGVAAETNRLLAELSQRIRADKTPATAPGTASSLQMDPTTRKLRPAPGSPPATNNWLDADLDLGRLSSALGLHRTWPAGLPRLAVTVSGAGGEVRTAGELKFPQPLPYEEAAWNIPTNMVHQPLMSFTAIRGFRPWLESQRVWQQLGLGAAPGQVCFWAQQGVPFLSYGAAPLPDASNCVARLTERLLNEGNAWVSTNARTSFMRTEHTNGVELSAPFMTPYLQSVQVGGSDYVQGGLFRPGPGKNSPAPPALFHEVTRRVNLVAYDWELTGPRLEAWFQTSQHFRMLFFRKQLLPDSASVKALFAAVPRLGNCVTIVTRTAPDRLSFVRRSAIGFNSVELNLLAEWLESPQFPRGFYSRDRYRPPLRVKSRSGTNSVPVPPRR